MSKIDSADSRRVKLSLSLIGCFLSGLGCGTMYLYSAYAPQLASRLQLSATDTSFMGMVGNLGMALTGPLAGSVVDRHGPTIPILIGGIATCSGYTLIKNCYANEISHVGILCGALLLVGIGSTFAFSAIVKCAALNFPQMRGFATSVPMAAFGLSAFFISTLAATALPGDTLGFLKILSYLPVGLFALCIYFVRFMPPPQGSYNKVEMTDLSARQSGSHSRHASDIDHDIHTKKPVKVKEIGGLALLKSPTFWGFFTVMGIVAGVGQMYIYSCGYCVKALLNVDKGQVSDVKIQQIQSLQVGIISLSSFAGRILSGSFSDFIHIKRKYQRTWLLVGAGIFSILAQIAGLIVSSAADLWIVSICTGFAYGICYGSFPTIMGDAFGMENFSKNWGLLALSPLVASYPLNMLFGKNYDAQSVADEHRQALCLVGRACYSKSFKTTILLAIFVVFLATEIIRYNSRRT